MTRSVLAVIASLAAGLTTMLVAGCGTTGSEPTLFPEVLFQVRPSGQSTFAVDSILDNGVQHTFPPGTTFTATGLFAFHVENAASPYAGVFRLVSGGDIEVTLFVAGVKSAVGTSMGASSPIVTVSSGQFTPGATPGVPNPEVRFDLCVFPANVFGCSTTVPPVPPVPPVDAGIFGLNVNGSVGDQFITVLIGPTSDSEASGTAPNIIFLENARDSANAVFSLAPQTGQTLQIQFYLNGELQQTQLGTQNVIVKQDL